MNDARKPSSSAPGRTDLEHRLSELERRLDLSDQGSAPTKQIDELAAELRQLRQAVTDLAAENLDLHNQLDYVVSSCDRLIGGSMGEGDSVRRLSRSGKSASLMERAARKAVRGTVGMARRLRGGQPKTSSSTADVDVGLAERPISQAARFAVVIRTPKDPEDVGRPDAIQGQTEAAFDLVVWNETQGRAVVHEVGSDSRTVDAPDRKALAAALSAELIADIGGVGRTLHPSVLERCRWTAASEGIPLLVDATDRTSGWRVESTAAWGDAATESSGSHDPALIKAVDTGGWGVCGVAGVPSWSSGVGRGYLVNGRGNAAVEHRVAPIEGLVGAFPAESERQPVLLVTSARGADLAAWVLRQLGDGFRFSVVVTQGSDNSPHVRALTELGARVYPLEGFLEPEVWPSLVGDLVRAHEVKAVLRIDSTVEAGNGDQRPPVIDVPFVAGMAATDADLVLALGGDLAADARSRSLEVIEVVPGPRLPGKMPAPIASHDMRSAYGVPDDSRLVLAVCDLEPDHRPEDVAAVARRLRNRADIHVLLVGQGTLAGAVSDVAGYFALEQFTFAPPGHPLKDLIAMCDCLLSTAETDPWPESVAAALSLGRNVVATEIDGVRELCAAADFDRCALCAPGDVDALAAAVIDATDTNRAPRITRKAWNAADKRGSAAADAVAEVLRQGAGDAGEGG